MYLGFELFNLFMCRSESAGPEDAHLGRSCLATETQSSPLSTQLLQGIARSHFIYISSVRPGLTFRRKQYAHALARLSPELAWRGEADLPSCDRTRGLSLAGMMYRVNFSRAKPVSGPREPLRCTAWHTDTSSDTSTCDYLEYNTEPSINLLAVLYTLPRLTSMDPSAQTKA
jgi:hypothetical protein